jgi:LacI family transcriptional regulator
MAASGVRLSDVAQAAGVGTSIASRVLNGDPTVSVRPETSERILEAAKTLNYRPNAFARGLKLARTMTLGMIINLAYSENLELIASVERRAAISGYVTVLADANEFVERGEAYRRLLLEGRVDGLLIATGMGSNAFVRELYEQRLPLVLLNRRLRSGGPSVTVDDAQGVREAVRHLVSLGHRRIGHIGGPGEVDVSRRRLAGYQAGMRAASLEFFSEQAELELPAEEGGFVAMERLLTAHPRPTAVTVWSVTAAVGALAAVRRGGLEVPSDVSVVALHESPVAAFLEPPLTCVQMPLREMAEKSVDTLLGVVEGNQVRSTVIRLPAPRLVERSSTAPPRASAPAAPARRVRAAASSARAGAR